MFATLLLGVSIGLVAVMSPGPVTIALVEVGASRGRASGLRAGLGVAGGEVVVCVLALAVVVAGAVLPRSLFTATQLVSSFLLLAIGAGLLIRPTIGHELVKRMGNPFRSMFALTALTPSVLGAWIAIFAAMPFADDPTRLAVFGTGGLVVSFVYHISLGGAAGIMGSALTDERRLVLARVGGMAMCGFATWTLF
jgi:threonine/homoserine/homoserine lactone efflux protein